MESTFFQQLTSPHTQSEIKAAALDQDRLIPLTIQTADKFAAQMNCQFASARTRELFSNDKLLRLANIMTEEKIFPFTAEVQDEKIRLTAALDKLPKPDLKTISDGVTEVCKKYAAAVGLNEGGKFLLSLLFQPAIYNTYLAAGMSEGSHTKYVCRGC